MKSNKAITLIGLIITIIVLLILAGITINLTLGDRGIFSTAKKSEESTIKAQAKEELELFINSKQLEYYASNYEGKMKDYLERELNGGITQSGVNLSYNRDEEEDKGYATWNKNNSTVMLEIDPETGEVSIVGYGQNGEVEDTTGPAIKASNVTSNSADIKIIDSLGKVEAYAKMNISSKPTASDWQIISEPIRKHEIKLTNLTQGMTYYLWARDTSGNVTGPIELKIIPIGVSINVTDESISSVKVAIDFTNASTKEYRIGATGTWQTYEEQFELTAKEVAEKNVNADDDTVVIYAKGTDGINEVIKDSTVTCMNFVKPSLPEISASTGCPTLTQSGVVIRSNVTITFDTSADVTNYYSMDGSNWTLYEGSVNGLSKKIYAKSVKPSGVEVVVDKPVSLMSNALNENAYNGKKTDWHNFGETSVYLYVDSSMWNHYITIVTLAPNSASYKGGTYGRYVCVESLSSSGSSLGTDTSPLIYRGYYESGANTYNLNIQIKEGTEKLRFYGSGYKGDLGNARGDASVADIII